jgi:hypothetical protein
MNAFALLLLAFPFYLAVQGRLIAYTSLVNASSTASPTASSTSGVAPITPLA